MNELGLQILNCVGDWLSESAWFTDDKFTLDYVCVDERGTMKDVSAACLIEEK